MATEAETRRFHLKSNIPACGVGSIYSDGKLTAGNGLCVAALIRADSEVVCV
ncbi:MAG: hypothetical protein C4532_17970 [Candidatus Abyssobacteria bacterium SURF_17]|jgi:uncharacterized protein YbbK (DUF523 family)|uniref:Uncharacterized protein n=1 Tax=Candidatus Abyssobacteria bacterium SURF_17 TaxID=2093361 RepID=A0A419EPZ1_9BACT|nr:MAG: hypothetical protein C4532_17970 [Candidatus Abyssubacteria bacterium SURF_17]